MPHSRRLTHAPRRGLAGAPGRTKRHRLRGLTAGDPHSLVGKKLAIFPVLHNNSYQMHSKVRKNARKKQLYFTKISYGYKAQYILCIL